MSTYYVCPRCDKPVIPSASEDVKKMGNVCTCEELPHRDHQRPPDGAQTSKRDVGHIGQNSPTEVQTVTLPYPPTANTFKVPVVGRGSIRTRFVLSPKAKAFKEEAEGLICASRLRCMSGPISLTMHVYRPRKTGDLDNAIKLCQDALTGHVFFDDEQVVEIHAYRHEDKTNPRVEITISRQ